MNSIISENQLIEVERIRGECSRELHNIVEWWSKYVVDVDSRQIAGEVDDENNINKHANKSAVFSTRLLWFFSEAGRVVQNELCFESANLIYEFLNRNFLDTTHGGIYWEIDSKGKVVNPRKQVYAQAFYIYALCSYYRLIGNKDALEQALSIFALIESRAHDDVKEGYVEALNFEWGPQEDVRLSDKEPNLPKTMNTHLHVLEAYTSLHTVNPDVNTALSLNRILNYFLDYLINADAGHLRMFFDNDWNDLSSCYSYGHDIECSWLLWEAVETLNERQLYDRVRPLVVRIAETCLREGSGDYGELLDGFDFSTQKPTLEHIWWVQAEALVGYLNAYQLSRQESFARAFINSWKFINKYQKNSRYGEWHWFSEIDLKNVQQHYKAGFWKAPYHNGRAMMEVTRRLSNVPLVSTG